MAFYWYSKVHRVEKIIILKTSLAYRLALPELSLMTYSLVNHPFSNLLSIDISSNNSFCEERQI
jgi:hypothetical protein